MSAYDSFAGKVKGNGRLARYRKDHNTGEPEPKAEIALRQTPMPSALTAFTLIEMLVAMAVLAMLMTFMFSMVGSTTRLWERGNAKIEAAQAARVGINRVAQDLESAFSLQTNSVDPLKTSVVPFLVTSSGTAGNMRAVNANGSTQLYGVRTTGIPTNAFQEFGYLCVFITDTNGWDTMIGNRYYLIQHRENSTNSNKYRKSTSPSWEPVDARGGIGGNRSPAIDNCIRFEIQYANTNGGSLAWTPTWSSKTNLPAGALITAIVIDSRTAERVAKLKGTAPLSTTEINSITNTGTPSPGVQSILKSGAVVMRRFIPFRGANYH